MRELCEVDTLGSVQLFIRAQHGEREHVQRRALGGIGHAGHDLGERPPLLQFALDDVGDTGGLRLLHDRRAFVLVHHAVGVRRRHRQPHQPHRLIADACSIRPDVRERRQRRTNGTRGPPEPRGTRNQPGPGPPEPPEPLFVIVS